MATHPKQRRAAPATAEALVALASGAAAAAAAARAAGRVAESATIVAAGCVLTSVAAVLRIGSYDSRVDARLEALQPCLEAQILAADLGFAAGTSRGLVPDETHMRAVAAKHIFDEDIDIGSITASEVRRRQRHGRMGPRTKAFYTPSRGAQAGVGTGPAGLGMEAAAPSAALPRGMAAASMLGPQAEAPSAAPPRGMAAASDGDDAEHVRQRAQRHPQQLQQPSSADQPTQHACDDNKRITPIPGRRSIGVQAAACKKAPKCSTAPAEAPSAAPMRGVAAACAPAEAPSAAQPRGMAAASDFDAAPSAAPPRGVQHSYHSGARGAERHVAAPEHKSTQTCLDLRRHQVGTTGAERLEQARVHSSALASHDLPVALPAPAEAPSAAPPRGMADARVFAAAPSAATTRGAAPADVDKAASAAAPSAAPLRGKAAADVQIWRMEADGASQADLRSNMKYAAAPSAASPRGTAATSVSLDMTAPAAASSAAPPRGMAEACVLGPEGTASLRKLCRDRILDLYSVHNPSKLQEVPDMIAQFKDQEHTLYLKVCSKYKIQPEPMLMSVPGLMSGRAVATAVMPPQSP